MESLAYLKCPQGRFLLEFAESQRDWTPCGADGRWQTADDTHEQSKDNTAGKEFRRDAEGKSQM